MTGMLLPVAGRDRAGRLLEEEDREARADRGLLLVPGSAPRAVVLLAADDRLGAFEVPVVVAELVGAVEHARALQAVHVIQVGVHGEVLAQPVHAGQRDRVLLVVDAEDVVVDHDGAYRARRHGVIRRLRASLVGVLVVPTLNLPRLAPGADGVLVELRARFVGALALDPPLLGQIRDLERDLDVRVVTGAEAHGGVLAVRVVAARAGLALLGDDDGVLGLRLLGQAAAEVAGAVGLARRDLLLLLLAFEGVLLD